MFHGAPYKSQFLFTQAEELPACTPHRWLTQLPSEGPVPARQGTCAHSGCFPSLKAFHCLSLEMLGQMRAALAACTRNNCSMGSLRDKILCKFRHLQAKAVAVEGFLISVFCGIYETQWDFSNLYFDIHHTDLVTPDSLFSLWIFLV